MLGTSHAQKTKRKVQKDGSGSAQTPGNRTPGKNSEQQPMTIRAGQYIDIITLGGARETSMILAVTHHRGEAYITTRQGIMFCVRSGARGMWTRRATWREFTGRSAARFELSRTTGGPGEPIQLEIGVVPTPPRPTPQELLQRRTRALMSAAQSARAV